MTKARVEEQLLIAILRGIRPNEVPKIADALLSAGVQACEVPLNSPDPFSSIEALTRRYGDTLQIGAGTVLNPDDVRNAAQVGARYCVSPNTDPAVIKACVAAELVSIPGWGSVSEALLAIKSGATALKLFPAGSYGAQHLRAARAVLPDHVNHFAVGGVGIDDIRQWRDAGATGFGIGSHIYQPGDDATTVARRAKAWVDALS